MLTRDEAEICKLCFCGAVTLRWEDCNARVARISGDKVESRRFFAADTGSVQNNKGNVAHARALTALESSPTVDVLQRDVLKARLKCQTKFSTCDHIQCLIKRGQLAGPAFTQVPALAHVRVSFVYAF